MITINCSTKDEADQVIGAFDIAYSVPEFDISFPYEQISISVNDVPYKEWGTFVNGLKFIESLQRKE